MATDGTLNRTIDSVLTFWRPAKYTYLGDLRARLAGVAFDHFCPEPRTAEAALKDALEEHFGTKNHRVEWLDATNAYEVVKIERGAHRNSYHHLHRFQIDDQGQVRLDPFDYDLGAAIIEKYNKHRALVRATAVTSALKKIAISLDATSPHDGAWWIHNSRVAAWRSAVHAVEQAAAIGNQTRVYIFNHKIGPDELRAVKDAITREVQYEAGLIHKDILEGDLKGRALKSRREDCEELRRKVQLFEHVLQTNLGELKVLADKADEAAVAAEILLSGEVMV